MRLTFIVESLPAIMSSILQRQRPLQKLFGNMWLHLIVLDIRTGQFLRYEAEGQWASVSMGQETVTI